MKIVGIVTSPHEAHEIQFIMRVHTIGSRARYLGSLSRKKKHKKRVKK